MLPRGRLSAADRALARSNNADEVCKLLGGGPTQNSMELHRMDVNVVAARFFVCAIRCREFYPKRPDLMALPLGPVCAPQVFLGLRVAALRCAFEA